MKTNYLVYIISICSCLIGHSEIKNDTTESFLKPFLHSVEGWPVEWNPVFKNPKNEKLFLNVKKALANHLQRITYILDSQRVKTLQKLFIRVDLDHKLGNMQFHTKNIDAG